MKSHGKSKAVLTAVIFEVNLLQSSRFGDLKFKYRNREFWCRGYYVDTVGKNKEKIRDYIKKQLEEDKLGTQLCLPYPGSPFTGRK